MSTEYENIGRAGHEMRKVTRRIERLSTVDMAADFTQAVEFRAAMKELRAVLRQTAVVIRSRRGGLGNVDAAKEVGDSVEAIRLRQIEATA
jgi:hypothetical protein